MAPYLETNLKFAHGHQRGCRLKLVSHFELLEGGLSEIRWGVLVPDVNGCVS